MNIIEFGQKIIEYATGRNTMNRVEKSKENVTGRRNKALVLDRDGTLVKDTMYPHKAEDFGLLPGVVEGLKRLSKDYIFVIITNQSGIGRNKGK